MYYNRGMVTEIMEILGLISPGVVVLIVMGVIVVGLLASGIVSVRIERADKNDDTKSGFQVEIYEDDMFGVGTDDEGDEAVEDEEEEGSTES